MTGAKSGWVLKPKKKPDMRKGKNGLETGNVTDSLRDKPKLKG